MNIDIATATTARSKSWKNSTVKWGDLIETLRKPTRTKETHKAYMSMSRDDQQAIKDVGGFVGGYLRNGRRKPHNVGHRQLITLDIDYADADFWSSFEMLFSCAAVLHSTHKHSPDSPRFRLIVPLDREVSSDEYKAISRRLAGDIGIELFDPTTFQPERLMFWPSCSVDAEYIFEVQDGLPLSADLMLASYSDWRDVTLWPTTKQENDKLLGDVKKQEQPETKKGIIGAFCRAYTISAVITAMLADVYLATDRDDRYTFARGSAALGVVTYGDSFSYSHHATDPTSGQLCNAFDLVRLHKFGHLDGDTEATITTRKSFKLMCDLAQSDNNVKRLLDEERKAQAVTDFADGYEAPEVEEAAEEDNNEWAEKLEYDKAGKCQSTGANIAIILDHDPHIKGAFAYNEFDRKVHLTRSVPWRVIKKEEPVLNVDFSGLRHYLDVAYGISAMTKTEDCLNLVTYRNKFHPVKEHLQELRWDGVARIDNLLSDYFGAKTDLYTREAIRKTLVGAVCRIFEPGCKFDLVLTLVSAQQGTGKSSFFRALAGSWFSDSFSGVAGKEAFEQLQGAWIIEMAELKGLRRAEVEAVKHYISKQDDSFRAAYAHVAESFKRQCIFVASTNEQEFLRDPSGNRRFLPVRVHDVKLTDNDKLRSMLTDKALIDQLWAEAVTLYKQGERPYLSAEAEATAEAEQERHSEADSRTGLVRRFLNKPIPKEWKKYDLFERREYIDGGNETGDLRERVCVAEIWCECLGHDRKDMDRHKTRGVNEIMRGLTGWKESKSTRNFPPYGTQRYYERI